MIGLDPVIIFIKIRNKYKCTPMRRSAGLKPDQSATQLPLVSERL